MPMIEFRNRQLHAPDPRLAKTPPLLLVVAGVAVLQVAMDIDSVRLSVV